MTIARRAPRDRGRPSYFGAEGPDRDRPAFDTVAQAELIPMQLGPIGETLRACLRRHPVETLKEGDFLINNDPFEGGMHLPDIFVFRPIYAEGRRVAFSATVSHHTDVGGRVPLGIGQGSMAILAHLDDGERDEVMRYNVPRIRHLGALDEVYLRTEVAKVRNQGYANTNSGLIEGMAGAAVPVALATGVAGAGFGSARAARRGSAAGAGGAGSASVRSYWARNLASSGSPSCCESRSTALVP